MIIWKKSDDNKVEYSLYDWKKLEKNTEMQRENTYRLTQIK